MPGSFHLPFFVFRHFWRRSYQNQLSFSGKDSTAVFFRFSSFMKNENGMKRSLNLLIVLLPLTDTLVNFLYISFSKFMIWGIGSTKTKLHQVQQRIADAHGSQCGFCTPGIVMSMYTLLRNDPNPKMEDIETYFQVR